MPPPPENNGSLYERLASHVPHVLSGEPIAAVRNEVDASTRNLFSVPYVRNNAQFLSFTALLTLINVGLIVGRLYEYSTFKNSDGSVNWCIMIARATGQRNEISPER